MDYLSLGSDDEISQELNFILRSEIKLNILKYLFYENLTIKDLSEKGLNYGSALNNVKQLEKAGYVVKINKGYQLTNSMKQKMTNLLYLNKEINQIINLEDYFNSHLIKSRYLKTLSQFPLTFDYELVKNSPLDPYKVVTRFNEVMSAEGHVRCAFTHIHPEINVINKFDAKTDTCLDIIVKKEMKDFIIKNKIESKKNLVNRTVRIKSIDSLNVSIVVNDKEAMITLYNKDGTYDTNISIYSDNLEVIDWINKLYDEIESYTTDEYTILNLIH